MKDGMILFQASLLSAKLEINYLSVLSRHELKG